MAALSEGGGTAWVGGGRGKHCDACNTTMEAHNYNTVLAGLSSPQD